MTEHDDYLFALELQNRLNGNNSDEFDDVKETKDFKHPAPSNKRYRSNLDEEFLNRTQNLVHPLWETLDPTPDVFSLFRAFDEKFFQTRLRCVTLEWSKRMYSCAGICYSRRNRFGMDITIRLSEPLLKLRPRKDLVETMLHEMIHAYCFVLKIREGNGGHGPNFKRIMYGINKVAGTNITVYHTFNDEVELYKQHWWRCNGSCQNRAPFFGYVKRTSNRAPGSYDQWWAAHQSSCGGTFLKIKGPDKTKKEGKNKTKSSKGNGEGLRKYFTPTTDNGDSKRRRITSSTPNINQKEEGDWLVVDEDIMLQDKPIETISVPSSDDDNDNDDDDDDDNDGKNDAVIKTVPIVPTGKRHPVKNKIERQNEIKQEIIDESIDLKDDDIVLIDDEYDDDFDKDPLNISAATELADTSIIDEFFGEDTLLKEFKEENYMIPRSSNYVQNPDHDIITCPICQAKLQRHLLSNHLDGCTGIAIKIQPPKHALKKLATISSEAKTQRKRRKSKKDILRMAGYTEEDLVNISSTSNEDDVPSSETTGQSNSPIDLDKDSRRYRQRNIWKTTRQCPKCAQEVEEDDINIHLDECLDS